MATIEFACPICETIIAVDEDALRAGRYTCPVCNVTYHVAEPSVASTVDDHRAA